MPSILFHILGGLAPSRLSSVLVVLNICNWSLFTRPNHPPKLSRWLLSEKISPWKGLPTDQVIFITVCHQNNESFFAVLLMTLLQETTWYRSMAADQVGAKIRIDNLHRFSGHILWYNFRMRLCWRGRCQSKPILLQREWRKLVLLSFRFDISITSALQTYDMNSKLLAIPATSKTWHWLSRAGLIKNVESYSYT